MPFPGKLKSLRGSLRSYLGVLSESAEERLNIALELAAQATEHSEEYQTTKDVAYIHTAIQLSQQAVDAIAQGNAIQLSGRNDISGEFIHIALRDQCISLRGLYFETDEIKPLEQCVRTLQLLYANAPKSSRHYMLDAEQLSITLLDRYFAYGEKSEKDAQDAVVAAQSALTASMKYKNKSYFAASKEDFVLTLALGKAKCIVNTPLQVHKGIYLYSRGIHSMRRFYRERDVEALRNARSYLVEAFELLPTAHEDYAKAAVELADCEVLHVDVSSDASGLESALRMITSLDLSKSSAEDFVKATIVKSLLYRSKFDSFSDPEDLDCAVEAARLATSSSTGKIQSRVIAWETWSNQLARRAEIRQSADDMNLAIQAAKTALDLVPQELVVLRAQIYATLGSRMGAKWSLFGGTEDLLASIEPLRAAVTILPKGHGSRALYLHSLAHALRDVFVDSGSMESLEESIRVEGEALSLVSKHDTQRYVMLDGLALSLNQRFRRLQHSKDLNNAIQASEEALAGTPKGGTRYPKRLHSMAVALNDRYMRQHQIQDVDRAVHLESEAISSGRYDESYALIYAKQLSSSLESRYRVNRNMNDLDEAIKLARDVVEKSNASHPLRARWRTELGNLLDEKFQCTTDLEERTRYLTEALSIQEECVSHLTPDYPDIAWHLCSLGNYRVHLNELLPEGETDQCQSNYLSAISVYQQGFNQVQATPYSRMRCGNLAGYCHMVLQNWESASRILSESIHMFQRISPLALDEKDRQERLHGLTGMSTQACIAYIKLGDSETGAEILEAGRGIMANISMRQHDRLPALQEASSTLHSQYIALRHSLSLPFEKEKGKDTVAKRTQDQAKFEEIEDKIRHLPGLENFNKSMSSSQIRRLADRGSLVSFCIDDTWSRAYALIVTKDAIESLPLPNLLPEEIEKMIPFVIGNGRLSLWKPTLRAKANTKMRKLLAWLWDVAVKPVLCHLKLLQDGTQTLPPRLWWVTSGLMGLMPLHAAGNGGKDPMENTYAHVVSSYASTFSVFAFARECQSRALSKRSSKPNVTLVTMPRTPARSPLATEAEAKSIRDAFSSSTTDTSGLVELCQPPAEEVQRRVRDSNVYIFHYSGHAEADIEDPSNSALLFGSDPNAPSPDPLPIEKLRRYYGVTNVEAQTPQLAYLSACCTAQQNERKLLDENIHLAAIFQAMGFPAVIGTLWEADDKAAAFIAKVFYEKLIEMSHASEGNVVGDKVAREDHIVYALHAATAACRAAKFGKAEGAKDVLLWANFVHFGA